MARKKKTEEPEVVEGFVSRNQDAPQADQPSRITLYLDAEGAVDWEKTKPETADQVVNTVANDPTLLEKVAECPEFQDTVDEMGWAPEDAGVLLDVLAKVEAIVCTKIPSKVMGMKVDADTFWTAFNISEEEHARQDPLAAKVMDKVMQVPPEWKPFVLLATAHSASVIRSFKDAIKLQMVKDGRMPSSGRTNGGAVQQPTVIEGEHTGTE